MNTCLCDFFHILAITYLRNIIEKWEEKHHYIPHGRLHLSVRGQNYAC